MEKDSNIELGQIILIIILNYQIIIKYINIKLLKFALTLQVYTMRAPKVGVERNFLSGRG